MKAPGRLVTLFDASMGSPIPLPPPLAELYGSLRLSGTCASPFVFGNFASTLDGVVAFPESKRSGGSEITGGDRVDRAVMGLLRSVADAVVVGAGTLRASPRHVWTAGHIFRELVDAYAEVRRSLGIPAEPLNVIVSRSGALDLGLPVFHSGEVESLVVTSTEGADRLARDRLPAKVHVAAASGTGPVPAATLFSEIQKLRPSARILVEGGPRLMAGVLGERRLDELFLTLAPQVAGRDGSGGRSGFVEGRRFAPGDPLWTSLTSVRRSPELLFLRYSFTKNAPRDAAPR